MGMCKRLVHPDTGLVEARVVDAVVFHREGGITAVRSHRGALQTAESSYPGCRVEEDDPPVAALFRDQTPLRVVAHLRGDQFRGHHGCPEHQDDAHVFYGALPAGQNWAGTSFEELAGAIKSGAFDPYDDNWFVLSRPDPDAWSRLAAVRDYLGG